MKLTRLMALVLVLIMVVSAFAACGEPVDTQGETQKQTEKETQKETEKESEEETVTEKACAHNRTKEEKKDPTCTEAGYIRVFCRLCDEQIGEDTVLAPTHTGEVALASVDGAVIRYMCSDCGNVRYTDKDGADVDKTVGEAAVFPFFNVDFTDADTFENAVKGFSDITLLKNQFAYLVVNSATNNSYANVPNGTSDIAPNGYFTLTDVNSKLATGTFTVKFKVQFIENPLEAIGLLTWSIGGQDYKLVSVDKAGNISVAGGSKTVALLDKGWDAIEVTVDAATGAVTVAVNGESITGSIASATGKTGSTVTFFEGASQFEANIDDISIAIQ